MGGLLSVRVRHALGICVAHNTGTNLFLNYECH